jgi:hypothetical protein
MNEKKSAPVYLQIREDGKVWAVLEDGTPLAHQARVEISSSAGSGGIETTVTLAGVGWLPPLPQISKPGGGGGPGGWSYV